jgi:hypothetical protein
MTASGSYGLPNPLRRGFPCRKKILKYPNLSHQATSILPTGNRPVNNFLGVFRGEAQYVVWCGEITTSSQELHNLSEAFPQKSSRFSTIYPFDNAIGLFEYECNDGGVEQWGKKPAGPIPTFHFSSPGSRSSFLHLRGEADSVLHCGAKRST